MPRGYGCFGAEAIEIGRHRTAARAAEDVCEKAIEQRRWLTRSALSMGRIV